MKKRVYKPAETKGLEWINEDMDFTQQETENTSESFLYDQPKEKDLPLSTSAKGLPEGWTRATFILKQKYLEDLKNIAYWERETIKTVLDVALERFLNGKNIPPRKTK